MDGHNGEWNRDVWATATEVQVDPSKVNGPGGTRRDMWHVPPELHLAAATPRMCMCPLVCYREVFGEDNFCDFCNADAVDECECAGEYFTADRSTGGAAPVPTTASPTTPANGARWT